MGELFVTQVKVVEPCKTCKFLRIAKQSDPPGTRMCAALPEEPASLLYAKIMLERCDCPWWEAKADAE